MTVFPPNRSSTCSKSARTEGNSYDYAIDKADISRNFGGLLFARYCSDRDMMASQQQQMSTTHCIPLGAIVECSTYLKEIVHGEVLCLDQDTRLLILRVKRPGKGKWELRYMNLSLISRIGILKMPSGPEQYVPTLPSSTSQMAEERLKVAIADKERSLTRAKVPLLGQRVFLAIHKTLDSHLKWEDDRIVVYGTIVVCPPYSVENVQAMSAFQHDNQALSALEHVRKIVDRFHSNYSSDRTDNDTSFCSELSSKEEQREAPGDGK